MTKKQSFEDALESLEQIVEKFESGELSLDQLVNQYEEGAKLAKFCLTKLDEAENKITVLNADGTIDDNSDLN
jgi:exodeoxyribonuclease VII small subunit